MTSVTEWLRKWTTKLHGVTDQETVSSTSMFVLLNFLWQVDVTGLFYPKTVNKTTYTWKNIQINEDETEDKNISREFQAHKLAFHHQTPPR